ncbi:unnamed protein product [Ambrosiozyma monospora]|uniref:ribonuclease H n=1 Tax=Ambrosiozyma monospora TaxID=43982 RepID=A0A9W6YS49_AMBMO|nr:unnamed protein product [Ambrosiozyma monospora]
MSAIDALVRKASKAVITLIVNDDVDAKTNFVFSTGSGRSVTCKPEVIHGLTMLTDQQSSIISSKTTSIMGDSLKIVGVGKLILLLKSTTGELKTASVTIWYAPTCLNCVGIDLISTETGLDHAISRDGATLSWTSPITNDQQTAPLLDYGVACIPKEYIIKVNRSPLNHRASFARGSVDFHVFDVYTDGACKHNQTSGQRRGGIGVFFGDDDSRNVSKPLGPDATNQIAELAAVQEALSIIIQTDLNKGSNKKYRIITDSQYAINCLTKWFQQWNDNGWVNAQGTPVSNSELIQQCLKDIKTINDTYMIRGWGALDLAYVRGHTGIYGNERSDQLANQACN